MARTGEPFLAVLTEDQLWLFRKAGAAFVQLGTLPATKVANHTRPMFWKSVETDFLWYGFANPNQARGELRRVPYGSLGFGAPSTVVAATGSGTGRYDAVIVAGDYIDLDKTVRLDGTFDVLTTPFPTNLRWYRARWNVSDGSLYVSNSTTTNPDIFQGVLSEDGELFLQVLKTGRAYLRDMFYSDVTLGHGVVRLNFFTSIPDSFMREPKIVGNYAYLLNTGLDYEIVICETENFTIHRTALPYMPVSSAIFGPYVAVGMQYDDGGLTKYTTRIFKQSGSDLLPLADYADIGGDLLFFADGSTLIDPVTRRALIRDGQDFTPNTTMLANLPAAVEKSAISDHVPQLIALAQGYRAAAIDMLLGSADLTNAKIMLANNLSGFDPDSLTVADALAGGEEVFGFGWPEGGIDLENLAVDRLSPSQLIVTGDNVDCPIAGGDITFRSAIIYSGDRPLIRLDLPVEVTIENGSLALVTLDETGLVVATA